MMRFCKRSSSKSKRLRSVSIISGHQPAKCKPASTKQIMFVEACFQQKKQDKVKWQVEMAPSLYKLEPKNSMKGNEIDDPTLDRFAKIWIVGVVHCVPHKRRTLRPASEVAFARR